MIRTLLILTVLAVLPHSLANAEFVVDAFTGSDFFDNAGVTGVTADDFGGDYSSVSRSFSGDALLAGSTATFNAGASAGDTLTITYDFSGVSLAGAVSDTFALGFYAENFRIEGLASVPTNEFDIEITAIRGNNLTESLFVSNVNDGPAPPPIFFDFTDLANVGILNDLESLSLTFTTSAIGGNLAFNDFALVANPEPTSAASFGLLGLIGLVGSTRRRKK